MSSKLDCYIFAFPAFFNKSEKTSFYKQLPAKPKPFVVCLMRASVRALGTGLARSHAVDNHHPVVAKYSNWYIALWSYLFGHDVLTMMCDDFPPLYKCTCSNILCFFFTGLWCSEHCATCLIRWKTKKVTPDFPFSFMFPNVRFLFYMFGFAFNVI